MKLVQKFKLPNNPCRSTVVQGSWLAKSLQMDFVASCCSPKDMVELTTTKQVVKKLHFQITIGKLHKAS